MYAEEILTYLKVPTSRDTCLTSRGGGLMVSDVIGRVRVSIA